MTAPDEDIRILELWHKGIRPANIAKILNRSLDFICKRLKVLERRMVSAQGVKL
jgi:predicted nucleotidyltransferase